MDKGRSFSVGVQLLSLVLLVAGSTLITGCMSMHTAARKGNVPEVEKQLAWGVNPNAGTFPWHLRHSLFAQNKPLHLAATHGHIEVVELLLENGAHASATNEGGETPLHYATRGGHTEVMAILLDHGANISAKGTGCGTPLQWAARNGQVEAARLLLAHGADINQKGTDSRTALMDAARQGDANMIELLLSRGADVNARASYSRTALHSAVWPNNVEAASVLLEHGADPAIKSNGRTALSVAVSREYIDMVKLLLSRGAPVNSRADRMPTALHSAAYKGNVEIGRILLEHGADPALAHNGRSVPEEFLRLIREPAPDARK